MSQTGHPIHRLLSFLGLPSVVLLACGVGEVSQLYGDMEGLSFQYVIMGQIEPRVERAGGDYHSFDLPEPDFELCMNACETETLCMAWTMVRPLSRGQGVPLCLLKQYVSPTLANENAVSGVKVPGVKKGTAIISYPKPTSKGRRLDWCSDMGREYPSLGDSQCGASVADAFCRERGHLKVLGFEIERNIGESSPTYMLGSGVICDQKACHGFSFIECMMKSVLKLP